MRDPAAPRDPSQFEWYCFTCTFRPWVDTGEVACATVTVVHADGSVERARAVDSGGRWSVPVTVEPGALALVQPGAIRDRFDEANGKSSPPQANGSASARAAERAAELAGQRIDCSRRR